MSSSASRKSSICIVSHFAYGAMTGDRLGHIGGVEWQTSITAKWLAAKGYSVSMITWNEGGPAEELIDGVRLIKVCTSDAGVKGLRFFIPRWTSLISALRRANADVYYHNCGESVTGQIALWCRLNGRRFVFSSANDTDCDPKLPEFHGSLQRQLFRYGLRHADHLIVQTERQRQMLRDGFGLDSVVIPMPCPGPETVALRAAPISQRVLWIARIWIQKRPDRLLQVADACPDLQFDFVGPAFDEAYSQEMLRRAKNTPNVTVHGAVSREKVWEFYQRAGCLCCTSDYEGFPNTFLEAWSHGLPIVSTFDPDSLIRTRQLGIVARDADQIVSGIREMFHSPKLYQQFSSNARRYYTETHTLEAVMPRFEKIFHSVRDSLVSPAGKLNETTSGTSDVRNPIA